MLRTCATLLAIVVLFTVGGLTQTLSAEEVTYKGKVVSAAEESVTVKVKANEEAGIEGGEMTFTLTADTKFSGDLSSAADLTEGSKVKVVADGDVAIKVMKKSAQPAE